MNHQDGKYPNPKTEKKKELQNELAYEWQKKKLNRNYEKIKDLQEQILAMKINKDTD